MRQCELCGKGSRMSGTRVLLRGHYNPTNRTRKYPNLQRTRTPEGLRVLSCTKCMRTMARDVIKETKKTTTKATVTAGAK